MNKFCPAISHRFLYLEVLGFIMLFFVIGGPNQARAQLVETFLVTSFSSYTEPTLSAPGSYTVAATVIIFSNIHNMACNVSVKWYRSNAILFCETILDPAVTILRPNASINHCSRQILPSSGIPKCDIACPLPPPDQTGIDQVEGSARVQIDINCDSKVGVDATTYYTLFSDDLMSETIISTRNLRIYQIDATDNTLLLNE